MLEFTISLKESALEFTPSSEQPHLELLLPPTARIGRSDDNVHLDPIPVHGFFNAIALGNWLAIHNHLSASDGPIVYLIHDVLKSFLYFPNPESNVRNWYHALDMFDPFKSTIKTSGIFENFELAFQIMRLHMLREKLKAKSLEWKEITWHEQALEPWQQTREADTIGLAIRLNPGLSNLFAIEHTKDLFIHAYVKAIKQEYAELFERIDEIIYQYEFLEHQELSDNAKEATDKLAGEASVTFNNRRLVIRTKIGAIKPDGLKEGASTSVRVPFWLLLTIYTDPTSIIFPIPSIPDDSRNIAFINRVKHEFHHSVGKLLGQVPGTAKRWKKKQTEILEHLDETLVVKDGNYDDVLSALQAEMHSDAICGLCGSSVSQHFVCSPKTDLGWSTSHYTDWHLGNIESACLFCAISNFKVPRDLTNANSLIKQRKLVFLSATTPNISSYQVRFDNANRQKVLPFFGAAIEPKLVINSLESLVSLNLVGALFIHNSVKASEIMNGGQRELWLKIVVRTNPFTFVGEIGKRQSKRKITALLRSMYKALNRNVTLIDPMMTIDLEIPFASLTCVLGNKQGKHYELKFKPLMVSNKSETLPVVCESFHVLGPNSFAAILQTQTLVDTLRGKGVSDSMKISALASDPNDLIEVLTAVGGCNIETVLKQLKDLGGAYEPLAYLERMRTVIREFPLLTELWR